MPARPLVSYVLATHNRRQTVLATVRRLTEIAAEAGPAELIVVDNASIDGTAEAIRRHLHDVRLIALDKNLGSCAKAIGVDRACGEYVVFLDDDSCPRTGSIARMIAKFRADDRLGAAGFRVHLPNGQCEAGALPNVFVGCGVCFRAGALRAVGGLDRSLFMQAEEYDLSFRLVRAGWTVKTFPDLHVDHLKTRDARVSGRTVYYDTRNNLIVAARYLPDPVQVPLMQDYTQRYRWIAAAAGKLDAYERGRREGWRRRRAERRTYARWRLTRPAFESLFRFAEIEQHVRELPRRGVHRIMLADLGKNIYPFVHAARRSGLIITCIADERFTHCGRRYRGVPVYAVAEGLDTSPDAVVVSNTSCAHAAACRQRLAKITDIPVYRWI